MSNENNIVPFPGKEKPIISVDQIKTDRDALRYIHEYMEGDALTRLAQQPSDPDTVRGLQLILEALEQVKNLIPKK